MSSEPDTPRDFIRQIIREDLAAGRHQAICTRFPPEPNGYLHIGHAKSICLNFGVAQEFGGRCNLRYDDTNPLKEDAAFAEAIRADVEWLGFDWNAIRHASDYFAVFYLCAEKLVRDGRAYVCDLDAEQVRDYRGTLTAPGRPSPWRDRGVDENLDLLRRMRAGEFADGSRTLRARIDMASGNINLRDPAIYRIRKTDHHRSSDAWCIYPMYDYAHCLSDAIEGITHSLCTLEFEDHRPLYDWYLQQVDLPNHPELLAPLREAGFPDEVGRPRQIEFSRLNIDYSVVSKRKLQLLVQLGHVGGWDDPRMPTLSGMRRRGYPPAAIREFCRRVGISKQDSIIELGVLEGCVREVLDTEAPRRMAVLRPLKLILDNYPEGQVEQVELANHPRRPELGSRSLPFSREIYIEQDDFMEDPPKGFHRLRPGGEVRLRGAYIIRCESIERDADGAISALRCSVDFDSRSGAPGSERKVKGTLHWVCAGHALAAPVRLFDRLFTVPDPDRGGGEAFLEHLNPASLDTLAEARLEPALATAQPGEAFQFERLGYFVADQADSQAGAPVFNRTATLRDSWARQAGR